MKSKTKKRSPLKDKPLRHAGQSLDEQIDDKAINLVMWWVVFPCIAIIFAALEWIRNLHPTPAQPIPITVIAITLAIIIIFKITKGVREIRTLRMGSDGEKLNAEDLLDLIRQSAAVLNDIQGNKFNIDHGAISTHGDSLIETKTHSKPVKKESRISFNDENVFVAGRVVDRQPIRQAKAFSKWLQELLQKGTGEKFLVQPVTLFPGWFVELMKKGQEVWILNPKALPTFIAYEPVKLKETDVHLVTFHLSRYIRTFETK